MVAVVIPWLDIYGSEKLLALSFTLSSFQCTDTASQIKLNAKVTIYKIINSLYLYEDIYIYIYIYIYIK